MNTFDKIQSLYFFKVVKVTCQVLGLCPLDDGATKFRIRMHTSMWCLSMMSTITMIIPKFMATYLTAVTSSEFFISLMECTILLECFVTGVVCRYQRHRLKVLMNSVRNNELKENLRSIITSYFTLTISFVTVILSYFYNTFSSEKLKLIFEVWYPFEISHPVVWYIVFVHQFYLIVNSAGPLITDGMCFMIMYDAIAKMDALKKKCAEACTAKQLINCVQNHREIMSFIEEFNNIFQIIIMKTTVSYFGYFTAGGFVMLLFPMTSFIFQQYILVMMSGTLRLYIYIDSADKLSELNDEIKSIMFYDLRYPQSKEMIPLRIIIMQRCQKPITISMSKAMPAMNKIFFSHYVKLIFSYFMTFRAMHMKLVQYKVENK